VANITITNIDLARVVLEAWNATDGVLRNASGSDQTYQEGTLLARDPATGELVPYAPAASPNRVVDVTVDVAAIANATAPDTAVVVAGALVGDEVVIEPLGTWNAGLTQPQGRVLVDGTVQVRIGNFTGAPIDPASQTLRFYLRHKANFLRPKYVLPCAVAVTTVAGTAPVTVLSAGKVNSRLLKVHGSPPTAATADDLDALMDRPIIPVVSDQQAKTDNPANP
jgi:hypothetical protein